MTRLQFKYTTIFQVEKFKRDGSITYKGEPFKNLTLDCGLLNLYSYSLVASTAYINIGAGSSNPSKTQTGLDNRLFSSNVLFNNISYGGYRYETENLFYLAHIKVFQFNIGTCTGNFSELGLSRLNNAEYFNRQLFKNSQGEPTTISVAADEGLRITCELRIYVDPSLNCCSEVIMLDLKGATGGSLTISNGLSSRTLTYDQLIGSFANLISYFSWPYEYYPYRQSTAYNWHPLALCQVNGKKLTLYGNGCNRRSLSFSITSNALTGTTGTPEFITLKSFVMNPDKQLQYERITDGTNVNITYYSGFCSYRLLPPFHYGTGSLDNLCNISLYSAFNLYVDALPAASSVSLLSSPTLQNLSYSKKAYWAPGKLGAGTQSVKILYIGYKPAAAIYGWYSNMLENSINVQDVEEFSAEFTISWGPFE